jgi:hypothetical protein
MHLKLVAIAVNDNVAYPDNTNCKKSVPCFLVQYIEYQFKLMALSLTKLEDSPKD